MGGGEKKRKAKDSGCVREGEERKLTSRCCVMEKREREAKEVAAGKGWKERNMTREAV